jgi:hypothetical protein
MHFSLFARAVVVLMICASVTATTGAQTRASPTDRLAAVDDHLTRFVVLKNSDRAITSELPVIRPEYRLFGSDLAG